jgi:hypothetical protein
MQLFSIFSAPTQDFSLRCVASVGIKISTNNHNKAQIVNKDMKCLFHQRRFNKGKA